MDNNALVPGGSQRHCLWETITVFSILGLAPIVAHFDDPGIEPGDDLHEVCLLPHDILDVLVDAGNLVGPGRQHSNALFLQVLLDGLPAVLVLGFPPGHSAPGTVGRRVFGVGGCSFVDSIGVVCTTNRQPKAHE